MLDSSRNSDSNVEFRRDNLSSLSNLEVVGAVARVDRRTGSTDGGSELVSEVVEELEVVGGFETTAASNDDFGGRELGAVGFGEFLLDPFRRGCFREARLGKRKIK